MSEAVNGDPKVDEQFMHDLNTLSTHVELFGNKCLSEPDDSCRNVVHKLGQRESREGVVAVDIMISELVLLRARLFQRNDICNEQRRGGLSSTLSKLRQEIAGG